MLLKIALLISMLIQIGATIIAIGLIKRTRYNVSWILISAGFVLMAIRRLYDFSTLFWDSKLFSKEDLNIWLAILISILMFIGVIFIRQIFNLQNRIDQIQKESELRVLSAVIQGEEKARQSLARDLHDGLGPILSSIKMTLSAIDLEQVNIQNKEIIEKTCNNTDEAIISLKEISSHLSPHLLKNYGLIQASKTFSEQLLKDSKIDFSLQTSFLPERLPYHIEINLYRIITELLTNSLKHGKPKTISLHIQKEENILHLRYRDDGIGFSTERALSANGMGLENIRSRVKSLDGQLKIESSANNGFLIDIHISQV